MINCGFKKFTVGAIFLLFYFFFSTTKVFCQNPVPDSTSGTKYPKWVQYRYYTKWLTIGTEYEGINSGFGLSVSNGFDEQPIIHFEDISTNILYKVRAQTNFNKDYSFDANLAWNNYFGLKYLPAI
jgi:hypothetical protein